MKKILALILVAVSLAVCCVSLSACDIGKEISNIGNSLKDSSAYDYAIISFPSGFSKKVELKAFLIDNANTGMVYIYGLDGNGYILSGENCMFVNEPELNINAKPTVFDSYKVDYQKVIIKSPTGEIITFDKPGEESVSSFFELYTDENGVRYYADDRNTIIEFTYE